MLVGSGFAGRGYHRTGKALLSTPSGRTTACWVHGSFLAVVCVGFQLEKLERACWVLEVDPSGLSKAVCLAVGFAPVLVFEGVWLGLAALKSPWGARLWKWGFINSHLLFYVVAVLENHYFMTTGSALTVEMLLYGIQHLSMLGGLLEFHLIGVGLVVRLALILFWGTLGAWVAEKTPRVELSTRLMLFVLVFGLGLPRMAVGNESLRISPSLWTDALGARGQLRTFQVVLGGQEAPVRNYKAPELGRGGEQMDVFVLVLESISATRLLPSPTASPRLVNLNRMANGGVVFDSAYTTISHTSKALTSMLCGFWPRPRMLVVEAEPGGLGPLRCAPELLGELGYHTLFAQTALGLFEKRPGLAENLGFDSWIVREDLESLGYEKVGYWGMDEKALVDGTLDWLDDQGSEPVFATLLTSTTHDPFLAPGKAPSGSPEADQLEALVAVDEALGLLLDGLESRGRLANSLFVILGDHGEGFGQHRRKYHDLVPFEEVTHVPLILWGANWVGESRVDSSLRSILDLLPTLLDVIGVDWEGTLAGTSLLDEGGHEEVITACWVSNSCSTLRRGDKKWIYYFGLRPTQVFDLSLDSGETRDIAHEQDAAEVRSIERLLLQHQVAGERWWKSEG